MSAADWLLILGALVGAVILLVRAMRKWGGGEWLWFACAVVAVLALFRLVFG